MINDIVWGQADADPDQSDGSDDASTTASTSGGSGVSVVENTIYFTSGVNEENVSKFNTELRKLDTELACKALMYGIDDIPIKLHICSEGGGIIYGTSAMDNISSCRMPVHTIVDGVCASAATFLSLVGDRRFIYRNSYMLIHQLSTGFFGTYDQFGDKRKNLDQFMKFIKDLYISRTNLTSKDLDKLLKHDLMWDAEKCLEVGLVDEII